MFISIPKSFFVPVLFSDKFELNSENNNMEYDTDNNNLRSVMAEMIEKYNTEELDKMDETEELEEKMDETEELEEKMNDLKEINLDKSNDNYIFDEADEEFVHSNE